MCADSPFSRWQDSRPQPLGSEASCPEERQSGTRHQASATEALLEVSRLPLTRSKLSRPSRPLLGYMLPQVLRTLLVSSSLLLWGIYDAAGAAPGEGPAAPEPPLYMHSGSGKRYRGEVEELVSRVKAGVHPRLLITGWHGELVATCDNPLLTDDVPGVRCEVQIPCSTVDPNFPSGHQHLYSVDTRNGAEGSVLVPSRGLNRTPNGWQLDGSEPRPSRVQWLVENN